MTNVRVKFQRSAYVKAYYISEKTPNEKKYCFCNKAELHIGKQ